MIGAAHPTQSPATAARWGGLALAAALLLPAAGCGPFFGAIAYYLGPRRIEKAQFKPTQAPLAILIEDLNRSDDQPVFSQAMFDRLVTIFRERKVNDAVVTRDRLARLRLSNPDFDRWSVQRVGRELGAAQVLLVRIERFSLRESPENPLITPSATLRLKVIDSNAPAANARLWPADEEHGRELSVSRPPEEATTREQVDTAVAKLGRDAAELAARFFYDVDLEEQTPKER